MFPLLRLPSLAQYEVIRNMELYHIFLLVQCSRRAIKFVQIQRIPIELVVDYSVKSKILKLRKHKTSDEPMTMHISNVPRVPCFTWKNGDQVIPVETFHKRVWAFWQNVSAGFEAFLEFLTESFSVKVASLELVKIRPEDAIRVLEHSRMLRINFGVVTLYLGRCVARLARALFDICANVEVFKFFGEAPSDFHYENFNKFSMNTLKLYNDPHVTVNDIIALSGGVQDLTLIVINFKQIYLANEAGEIELDVVLDGLNAVEQPNKSYEVRRDDGIIGTLEIYKRGVHLVVRG